jgi:hypothetical protein
MQVQIHSDQPYSIRSLIGKGPAIKSMSGSVRGSEIFSIPENMYSWSILTSSSSTGLLGFNLMFKLLTKPSFCPDKVQIHSFYPEQQLCQKQ